MTAYEISDFKVYPVQVVSRTLKTRSENGGSRQQQSSSRAMTFSAVLDRAMTENQPADCYTVTYNANKELQTYFYQPSREYSL